MTLDDVNVKELYAANVGVLVRMKTQVAATSAAVRYAGSVDKNAQCESNSKEETLETIKAEPISDSVNRLKTRDQLNATV